MGGIPPISSSYYTPPPPPSDGNSNVLQQLQQYLEEYQTALGEWLKNPASTSEHMQLIALAQKIETFLKDHKEQIFAAGKAAGWPANGPEGYENFYNGAVGAIHNFLTHPNVGRKDIGPLEMANEQITELHWLLTHHPTH